MNSTTTPPPTGKPDKGAADAAPDDQAAKAAMAWLAAAGLAEIDARKRGSKLDKHAAELEELAANGVSQRIQADYLLARHGIKVSVQAVNYWHNSRAKKSGDKK